MLQFPLIIIAGAAVGLAEHPNKATVAAAAAAHHYQSKHVLSIFADTFSGRTSRLSVDQSNQQWGAEDPYTMEIIRMQSLRNALINYNYHN